MQFEGHTQLNLKEDFAMTYLPLIKQTQYQALIYVQYVLTAYTKLDILIISLIVKQRKSNVNVNSYKSKG